MVSAQHALVASIDDVLVTKLLAINEQEPDFRVVRPQEAATSWAERRSQDVRLTLRACRSSSSLEIVDLDAGPDGAQSPRRPATRLCESPAPLAA